MLTAANLNVKTVELLSQYKDLLTAKLEALTELIQIERGYLTTLPGLLQKQRKQDEQMNETKVKKIIDHINPQKMTARRKNSFKQFPKDLKANEARDGRPVQSLASAVTKETLS